MQNKSIIDELDKQKVIIVIRNNDEKMANKIIKECINQGLTNIEITMTMPFALNLIKKYQQNCNIGVGSVKDPMSAALAINHGAKYLVGPNFNLEIAKLCNLHNIDYIPGIMTVTEINRALEYGVKICKLFPANSFDPNFIKAVNGPYPNVKFIATGGINMTNMKNWLEHGALAVGIGSELNNINDNELANRIRYYREYRDQNG